LLVAGRDGKGTNMAKFPTKGGEKECTAITSGGKKFELCVPPFSYNGHLVIYASKLNCTLQNLFNYFKAMHTLRKCYCKKNNFHEYALWGRGRTRLWEISQVYIFTRPSPGGIKCKKIHQ